MSNLPQINRKIKSVKTTAKITNALKVVSSNQSYVYRELQKKSLPYLQGIYRIFFEVFSNPDHDIRTTNKRFISYSSSKKELWIILGTDIGMCGDFNEKIKKYVFSQFEKDSDGFVIIGKQLALLCEKGFKNNIELSFGGEITKTHVSEKVKDIAFKILDVFMQKHYQKLTMVYLKNPKEGVIEKINILPFTEKYFVNKKKVYMRGLNFSTSYPDSVIDLFPQYLECIVMGAIVTSKIGEHNIRRELMHNATKNANELLDEYTLTFNKLRQANITQEITEIVVAVNAKKR